MSMVYLFEFTEFIIGAEEAVTLIISNSLNCLLFSETIQC